MSDLTLTINEGTMLLILHVLRRNGRPDATGEDVIQEIKSFLRANRGDDEDGGDE